MRPTILLAPPRMWERIYSTICTELRKRPGGGAPGFLRRAGAGAGGGPLPPARQARAGAHPASAQAGRPAAVPQSPHAIRRTAPRGRFGRRAAQQGSGRVLRGRRYAADRGLRLDRGWSGHAQSARPSQARQHRQAVVLRRRGAFRRRWRNAAEKSVPVFRLFQGSRRPPPKFCAMAGCTPATSLTPTTTATSSSPAARKS